MKVGRTTFEEEQKEKEDAFFKLTPLERLAHHQEMLKKIYGQQLNAPLPATALVVRRIATHTHVSD